MKKALLLFILILCVSTSLMAQPGRGLNQSKITSLYDASKEMTFTGEVIRFDTVQNDYGRFPGLLITVKSEEQELPVFLAPNWYLTDQKISIKNGEEISVTGSKINFKNKDQIIARIFEYGDKKITVRNEKGIPVWAGKRMGPGRGRRGNRR
ncbi:hypothetical protein GF337_12415 [candidate division KSB1 bacterium]|nr:hypothetical protein [candidate division KSB1 bacterium]